MCFQLPRPVKMFNWNQIAKICWTVTELPRLVRLWPNWRGFTTHSWNKKISHINTPKTNLSPAGGEFQFLSFHRYWRLLTCNICSLDPWTIVAPCLFGFLSNFLNHYMMQVANLVLHLYNNPLSYHHVIMNFLSDNTFRTWSASSQLTCEYPINI